MKSLKPFRLVSLIAAVCAAIIIMPTTFAEFDVDESHPNYDAIMYLMDHGIVEGYMDGSIKPDQEITRAELLKIFVASSTGVPETFEYNRCFIDVEILEWYIRYVCYAKSMGWVEGYEDGSFKPHDPIDNIETLAMLFRTQEFYPPEYWELYDAADPFLDVSLAEWYGPDVWYAKEKGIIDADGDYFYPGTLVTRGEAFEMLYRTLVMKEELSKPIAYSYENLSFTHSGFYTELVDESDEEFLGSITVFLNEQDDGIAFMPEDEVQLLEEEMEMTLEEIMLEMDEGVIADDIEVKTGKVVNIGNYNEYYDSYYEGEATFFFKVEPVWSSGEAVYVIAHYSDEATRAELIDMFKTISVT